MSPYARFLASAHTHGDRLALALGETRVSHAELLERASAVRRRLEDIDVGRNARVGVVGGGSRLATYVGVLGAAGAGATYVPLPAQAVRQTQVATAVRLSAVCGEAATGAGALAAALGVPFVDTGAGARASADWSAPDVEDSDVAYILPTSGSSGAPKLVPITVGNISSFLSSVLDRGLYALGPDDRFLQMFAPTFDLWAASLFLPLSIGASSHVIEGEVPIPAAALATLSEHAITFALMVPSLLTYVREELERRRLPALRYSLFCGEPLRHDLAESWARCAGSARIENAYGPTEATIWCTRYVWTRGSAGACVNGVVPIGDATPGNVVELLDTGEIVIAGPQVMEGYLGSSVAEAFVTLDRGGERVRAYRTGDLGRRVAGHGLVFCGRVDDQLKIDGYRVEPGEVEHVARELGASTCVAVAISSPAGANELHLVLEGVTVEARELLAGLRQRLPDWMVPKAVHVWPQLPLTAHSKIDRREVARRLSADRRS